MGTDTVQRLDEHAALPPWDRGNPLAVSLLVSLALLKVAAHLVIDVAGRYGYFRDELYYVACSDHLALGYVDHPPLSIFILALSRGLFGDSLVGLRLLSTFAGGIVIVLTGVIVRRLGGGRFAQLLAAVAVLFAPIMLIQNMWFSMNAFDILFWTLALYLVVLVVETENPKRWLGFGVVIGLGLLNKYSIGFLCIGLVAGMLLTPMRRHLTGRWFWSGAVIAALLFLPHVLWEVAHGFPSIEFMRNAALEKNAPITAWSFLLGQFDATGEAAAALWILGLFYCFVPRNGRRYRFVGWMYVAIFVLMVAGHAKAYYLSPVYPTLLAFGALHLETWARQRRWRWIKPFAFVPIVAIGVVNLPFAMPVLPVDTFIRYQSRLGATPSTEERQEMGALPQYYADMFGWEKMVATIAAAYQGLSPEEREVAAIVMDNYGEAGAIDFFGPRHGLPKAICGHNNYWIWGPRDRTGEVIIRLGGNEERMRQAYADFQRVGTFTDEYCMPYENNKPVYVCRRRHIPLSHNWEIWKHFE
jgi:hypothetical protein